MGTDWKIYKPNKKVNLNDLKISLNKIANLHCDDEQIVCINSQTIESAKQIINLPNLSLEKLGLRYLLKSQKELVKLCTDNRDAYKFFWIGNENVHAKSDRIKFQLTYNLNFDKLELLINIPYHNKSESIIQSINLIKHINEPLDLHFRNHQEIEKDITNFIELNIDNNFYDNEWTLKHSHYVFKASGARKQIYEDNKTETFRLTGFRIIFPEHFIKMTGFKKYGQNILNSFLDYYHDSTLELFMYGNNVEIIDNLSKYKPEKTENKLELLFRDNTIDEILKNPKLFFDGKMNDFRLHKMKFKNSEENYFNVNLYGQNIEELKLDVEIDKKANDEYINRVLSLFSVQLDYKYEE